MTSSPTPVLEPGRLYLAHDRVICVSCAGVTALYTGVTIGGAPVVPVVVADVTEWAGYDLGPLLCEGGHLEASLDPALALVTTAIEGAEEQKA